MTTPQDELFGVGILERGLDLMQTLPAASLGRGPFAVDVTMKRYVFAIGTASVGLAWSIGGAPVAVAAQLVSVGPGNVARFELREPLGDLQVWTTDPEDVASAVVRSIAASRDAASRAASVDPLQDQLAKLATGGALALVVYAALKGRQR